MGKTGLVVVMVQGAPNSHMVLLSQGHVLLSHVIS